MASIRCAWGHVHATVAEVRACAAAHRDEPSEREGPVEDVPSDTEGPEPGVVVAGPDWLGRDAIISAGQDIPGPWTSAMRVVVDDGLRSRLHADPATVLGPIWTRRHARLRTVFVLDAAGVAEAHGAPAVITGPVWRHPPDLLLAGDVLADLVTSNAVDLRPGRRPWPWADRAIAAGARRGGPADVLLPDGTPAWCDGGPPTRFDPTITGATAIVHRVAIERGSLTPLPTGHDAASSELAPDQLAAVAHPGGAARIIAPAGSGKTRVLTERARQLLSTWRVPASALCLVAFNTRAADEIRVRTADLAGLHVRTLNALGLAILDGAPPFASRRRDRRLDVLAETDVRALLDTLVKPARAAGTDPLATWIAALSEVRLRLRDPALVEADYDGDVDGLPGVVDAYRAALVDRGAVDFDEQIVGSIELLLADPDVRAAAQRACRFLLVDEFQDLAPAHLLLLRLLASPELSVFGVGDDDQTIYGFSGATPEWLIRYEQLFPGAGHHPLTVNYRCPPDVVGGAGRLLLHNLRRVTKEIRAAHPDAAGGLSVRRVDDVTAATADAVAGAVATGAAPADVVVLARVGSALLGPQVELRRRGFPVVNAIGLQWLQRTGVRAALAWLRLAGRPIKLASSDVEEAARRPSAGRSRTLIGWMAEQSSLPTLRALAGRLKAERDQAKVTAFADLLERLAATLDGTTAGLVATLAALRQAGLDDTLDALDRYRHDETRAAHLDDLDSLVELARICPDPSAFPAWLREELARPGDDDGVRLSTVHRVKGLEWPHVVVHDASDSLFPHRLTSDRQALEEERRVFHVAITRCRSTCTVVVPIDAPSPFVAEMEGASPTISLRSESAAASSTATGGRASSAARPARVEATAGPPSKLEEALRAWRSGQARQEGRPAFVIVHDATIREIVARRPTTLAGLAAVPGIGPAKLERYGDDILAVVAEAR